MRRDFSGGLNTTSTVEGIAENQLADVLNMEVDHSTGCLKTVAGTKMLLTAENVFAAAYDGINHVLLVVLEDKTVHVTTLDGAALGDSLGKLTGELYPVCAAWEDELLLASGGKLQYYNGKTLVTLESPDAKSVYIRAGRVLDDALVLKGREAAAHALVLGGMVERRVLVHEGDLHAVAEVLMEPILRMRMEWVMDIVNFCHSDF